MLGAGSRLRFVISVVLLFMFLFVGWMLVFLFLMNTMFFLIGGGDLVRQVWEGNKDWKYVDYIALLVAIPFGMALGFWLWYLLMSKTRFIDHPQLNYLLGADRQSSPETVPPVGLGFTANVVWIVLVVVLAGVFSLAGYHLANIPYEGWEGMQRYLRFPVILVPRYPFRVSPLLTMAIFGGFGAWLAEKIFRKIFPRENGKHRKKDKLG